MLGDIYFYQGNDFFSRAIELATHGPYSHVAIDCGDETMIQATTHGINRAKLDHMNATRLFTSRTTPAKSDGYAWLQTTIGYKYDFYDIALAALFAVAPSTARLVPYIPDDHYICSELAAWFLRAAGFPFTIDKRSDTYFQTLSPNALYKLIQETS